MLGCESAATARASRKKRALPSVRCEQWGGWWFVNLDPDAMPLLEWLAPLPDLLPEVAAALGRSVHATESLLVRARIAFRASYLEHSDE